MGLSSKTHLIIILIVLTLALCSHALTGQCNGNGLKCYSFEYNDFMDCSKRELKCIPEWNQVVKSKLRYNENQIDILHQNEFRQQIRDWESLGNVKHLDLSFNKIRMVEYGTFTGLDRLETLNLAFNNFSAVPSESFNDVYTSLEHLILRGNPITKIQTEDFKSLSKLTELDLRFCRIATIADSAFVGLDNLETLLLQQNVLVTLHSKSFISLSKLQTLNLSENQLRVLHPASLKGLFKLLHLNWNGNPLQGGKWSDVFDLPTNDDKVIPCDCSSGGSSCKGHFEFEISSAACVIDEIKSETDINSKNIARWDWDDKNTQLLKTEYVWDWGDISSDMLLKIGVAVYMIAIYAVVFFI